MAKEEDKKEGAKRKRKEVPAETRKVQNAQFYDAHKEAINKKRREKYKKDKEYRSRVVERMRERRKSESVGVSKREFGKVKKVHRTPRLTKIGDEMVKVYSLGHLAEVIGYSYHGLCYWKKKDVLPKPTLIDDHGRWWVSQDYIDRLLGIIQEHRGDGWSLAEFKKLVRKHWKEA